MRDLLGGEVLACLPDCKRHSRLEETDVDQLPFAGLRPHAQRGQGTDRRIQSTDKVADWDADFDWIAVNRAGDAHQAATGLCHDIQPWKLAERPVLAPT